MRIPVEPTENPDRAAVTLLLEQTAFK